MKNKTKSKKGIQPKLRFYEFRDKDGWAKTNIGSIGNFYYGKSAPKWSLEENALTPCVRYGELYTRFGPVITKTYSLTNIKPNELRFSKGGEILIPRVGEKPEDFGKNCCYLPLRNIAIGEMISVFETTQNPLFYTYYFRNLYKEFAKVVEGQNVKNLYYSELEPLTVFCPSPSEQQKIANCLSSLDELIETENQKLKALQDHKKGLMQELFPEEGKTLPKRRFPEFRNYPKWEETPISAIGDIITGSTPSTNQRKFYGDKWQFVSPVDIGDGRYIDATKTTLSEEGFAEIRPVKANSILFVCIGSTIGKVAQNIKKCATNQQINSIVPNNNYDNAFVYFILDWHAKQIAELAGNQAVPIINKSTFGAIKIRIPKLAEQQRIADFLTSIDDLITTQTKKLKSLGLHKKGLMQQLFPNASEVKE